MQYGRCDLDLLKGICRYAAPCKLLKLFLASCWFFIDFIGKLACCMVTYVIYSI
jgi:hypothetical protein